MTGTGRRPAPAATTTTLRLSNIPLSATAPELFSFFDSTIGSVFACKISASHLDWKSKGIGRVQFDTPAAASEALRLFTQGLLPLFQCARLHVVPAPLFDEIVVRSVKPAHRVRNAVLHVGYLKEEKWLEILESWINVRVDFMPERKRIDLWVEDGCESYKMEVMFSDIIASSGCCLVGLDTYAILLRLKYTPRLHHKVSAPALTSHSGTDRFCICKENFQFRWVRTADFSTCCSIGQSTYFCVELPEKVCSPEIVTELPMYHEFGDLTVTVREQFCTSSRMVPVIYSSPDCMLSYEIIFQLNSLVHAQKISLGQLDTDLLSILSGLAVNDAKGILLKMHKLKSTCYDPVKFIDDQLNCMSDKSVLSYGNELAENFMNCHRVLVTPSKVYFLGPEVETSNYVVKHYSERASDFLRVSFVDEDWTKLSSDAISTRIEHGLFSEPYKTKVQSRILSILSNGIQIGRKNFEFLAFSASQLRSNSVWMFASNETLTAESIREWMGQFKKIRSVSKCAARMGQLFSSSLQTLDVYPQDVEIVPDIEIKNDGVRYCFSDGIGKISAPFAMQVARKCGLNEVPSAFQIRYGGYKGVIAVDRFSFYKLSLRPSMLKFDSNNTMLNITKWSDYMPCYLNREIVCLLSTLGIRDEIFERLQDEQLQILARIFTDREIAIKFLATMSGDTQTAIKMLVQGYDPKEEPYLLMLLKTYHECHLSDIRRKCRIFVPKGRVLLGCLDETGSLNYGQVYIRVTLTKTELQNSSEAFFDKVDKKTAVVMGKVVVTKNPCLHPGDIRILEAVTVDFLEEKGLVDCIIFPQKGHRPHPNECSGGDLDGDLYFVCWDEDLIPNTDDSPMDYVGRRPRIMDHEVHLEEIHNFFVDYMINDTLGAISTAHLVHADRDLSKARSPKCLQLANLHSMAVDFAKTGSPAEMPKALRPKEYPDFMERSDKPMYISTGVLGKLYRRTVCHMEEVIFIPRCSESSVTYDYDLQVEGFKSFLEVAEDYKNQYAEKLSALMNYFGAESEDEILTGNLRNRAAYLERDKNRYEELKGQILLGISTLQKEVMSWFRGSCNEQSYPKMASACYHVTYDPQFSSDTIFFSFPWIFCDLLLSIKSSKVLAEMAHPIRRM